MVNHGAAVARPSVKRRNGNQWTPGIAGIESGRGFFSLRKRGGFSGFPGGFIGGEAWVGHVELYKSSVQKGGYRYPFKAANLHFDATWTGPGALTVHFYDYPDGLNEGDKDEKKLRKLLATHHYRYDQHAGAFVDLARGE
jgi:hypothetical protein